MRTALRTLMVPALAVFLAATAGCSDDHDGEGVAKGKQAEAVCGAFAKDAPALGALKALVGNGGLVDDRSQRDETLKALRDADGELSTKELANGSPFCRLQTASDGEAALDIVFREAVAFPDGSDTASFAAFSTGESAQASDRYAKIAFKCRMKESAKEIGVAAELERPGETKAAQKDLPALQVTVLNAAARTVAAGLGCQNDTKLVAGVPSAADR
ncbi:hypothetical protein ACFU5O_04650 [Streptomyces sp. NPDC057445]|uniref:hypothetical protein n=1 Tax=Streptomyces sp. NPDC057445 TaxID=3346136 RepID=UPI0036B205A4